MKSDNKRNKGKTLLNYNVRQTLRQNGICRVVVVSANNVKQQKKIFSFMRARLFLNPENNTFFFNSYPPNIYNNIKDIRKSIAISGRHMWKTAQEVGKASEKLGLTLPGIPKHMTNSCCCAGCHHTNIIIQMQTVRHSFFLPSIPFYSIHEPSPFCLIIYFPCD